MKIHRINIHKSIKYDFPIHPHKVSFQISEIDSKKFEQCAGFLRIRVRDDPRLHNGSNSSYYLNPLDRTWIHPEHYPLVHEILRDVGVDIKHFGTPVFRNVVQEWWNNIKKTKGKDIEGTLDIGLINLIIEGLTTEEGFIDIRRQGPKTPSLKLKRYIHTLSVGQRLEDCLVSNITSFGVFVDIGIGTRHGLIHSSKLLNEHLLIGQMIDVVVLDIDYERERVSLQKID